MAVSRNKENIYIRKRVWKHRLSYLAVARYPMKMTREKIRSEKYRRKYTHTHFARNVSTIVLPIVLCATKSRRKKLGSFASVLVATFLLVMFRKKEQHSKMYHMTHYFCKRYCKETCQMNAIVGGVVDFLGKRF